MTDDEFAAELAKYGIDVTVAFLAAVELLRQCATADDCPPLVSEHARAILRRAGLWPMLAPEAGDIS